MRENFQSSPPSANHLLAAFSKRKLPSLIRRLESITLDFGDRLHQPGETVREVYFPTSSVVSIFVVEDQNTFEVGMVGSEGATGISLSSGANASPHLAVVLGAGVALKMAAADFLAEYEENKVFARAVNRYNHFLHFQVSQAVICNRLHLIEARLACLLLLLHDRLKTNQFKFKQEFLAKMLGFRRQAVTVTAGNLQLQQIIRYSRGNLQILDRARLEAICCRCYQIITKEYCSLTNTRH